MALSRRTVLTSCVISLLSAGAASTMAHGTTPAPGEMKQASGRPLLAPPVERPAGVAARLDTTRRPDAKARAHGIRLELWVPQEPVDVGSWLSAVMRVTNAGQRTVVHHGSVKGDCSPPAVTRLDIASLFDAGVEQTGNAAKLKRLAGRDWPLRMGMFEEHPDVQYGCLDFGVTERLRPGESFVRELSTWPHYASRDQPLPSGTASVVATYHFTRILPSGKRVRGAIEARAPVGIIGQPVEYPSPQQLVDAMIADPVFGAWLDERRPAGRWELRFWSILAPDGQSFSGLGYPGGPAPDETTRIYLRAPGGPQGTEVHLDLDPWTGTVEDVEVR